jgi:ferric enterobactin receptor
MGTVVAALLMMMCGVVSTSLATETNVRLVDAFTKRGVPGLTCKVLSADSVVLSGTKTDSAGLARLSLVANSSILVTGLGYQTLRIESRGVVPNGEYLIHPTQTADVVVEAMRDRIRYEGDKTIVELDQQATLGPTAMDALAQLPGVRVDQQGGVSLRGNPSVQIQIDGKPIEMYGDRTLVLQSVPTAMLKTAELISNPSARYDAEGGVGIINLTTRKMTNEGFHALAMTSVGLFNNNVGMLSANLNTTDVNWFATAAYNSTLNVRNRLHQTNFIDAFTQRRPGFSRVEQHGGSFRLGADIPLAEQTSLTIAGSAQNSGFDQFDTTSLFQSNTVQQLLGIRQGLEGSMTHLQVEASLTHQFEQPEHTLRVLLYAVPNTFNFTTTTLFRGSEQPVDQRQTYSGGSSQWFSGQLDYTVPFANNILIEAGAKTTNQYIQSQFRYSRAISNVSQLELVTGNNNSATDVILASYAMARIPIGVFTVQGGLRYEHTINKLETNQQDLGFSRSFGGLFPSLSLGMDVADGHRLTLATARRIERPDAQSMNPFLDKQDSLIWKSGNPQLLPQYTVISQATWLHQMEGGSLTVESYYATATDVINLRFREVVSPGTLIEKPYNFGQFTNYGTWAGIQTTPWPWVQASAEAGVFYQEMQGSFRGVSYASSQVSWYGQASAYLTLDETTSAQLDMQYVAPEVTPQGKRFAYGAINVALQKSILDKRLQFTLRCSDIFNMARFGGDVQGPGFATTLESIRANPLIALQVQYRLNNYHERPQSQATPPAYGNAG